MNDVRWFKFSGVDPNLFTLSRKIKSWPDRFSGSTEATKRFGCFTFLSINQRIEVDGDEFFIDLLFLNRHLQSLVALDLLCCASHKRS